MKHRHDILFLIADGGHARFVRRADAVDHFRTVEQIDGGKGLDKARAAAAGAKSGRTFVAGAGASHGLQPRSDVHARARDAFVREVADAAVAFARKHALAGAVLVAPPPVLNAIRARLDGHVAVLGELAKDLAKIPDHDLGDWLNSVELLAAAS